MLLIQDFGLTAFRADRRYLRSQKFTGGQHPTDPTAVRILGLDVHSGFGIHSSFTRIGLVPGWGRPLLREGCPIGYEARPSGYFQPVTQKTPMTIPLKPPHFFLSCPALIKLECFPIKLSFSLSKSGVSLSNSCVSLSNSWISPLEELVLVQVSWADWPSGPIADI